METRTRSLWLCHPRVMRKPSDTRVFDLLSPVSASQDRLLIAHFGQLAFNFLRPFCELIAEADRQAWGEEGKCIGETKGECV